jgi:hypothetical protein
MPAGDNVDYGQETGMAACFLRTEQVLAGATGSSDQLEDLHIYLTADRLNEREVKSVRRPGQD